MIRCLRVAFRIDLKSPLLSIYTKAIAILHIEKLIGLIVEFISMINILRINFVSALIIDLQ
jgi:hypothetical protein